MIFYHWWNAIRGLQKPDEFWMALSSDKPIYANSPWGWHERIRHLERDGWTVTDSEKFVEQQDKPKLFSVSVEKSVEEFIQFKDGSIAFLNDAEKWEWLS
jgi:hypothetical protein